MTKKKKHSDWIWSSLRIYQQVLWDDGWNRLKGTMWTIKNTDQKVKDMCQVTACYKQLTQDLRSWFLFWKKQDSLPILTKEPQPILPLEIASTIVQAQPQAKDLIKEQRLMKTALVLWGPMSQLIPKGSIESQMLYLHGSNIPRIFHGAVQPEERSDIIAWFFAGYGEVHWF